MPPAKPNNRLPWERVPSSIHRFASSVLGSDVVSAASQAGGYSPGSADRLAGADGACIFVKAVSHELNSFSYELFEQEVAVCVALKDVRLPAPRLLGHVIDGDWIALAFEDIDGHEPGERDEDVAAVLDALEGLPLAPVGLRLPRGPFDAERTASAELAPWSGDWARAVDAGLLDVAPMYATERSAEIASLADAASAAVAGNHIVHMDLHTDNVVIDGDARAWIVDWPWAVVGAAWLDSVSYLASMLGALPVEVVDAKLAERPSTRDARPDDVNAVIAALAASRLNAGLRVPSPSLIGLRDAQRSFGLRSLDWLAYRRGW
jgi:hypothetical protein